ncbi:polysaccharide deacetylase family protein [Paenibacillus sonchi]|nr:polysaccharide deacetylase family protein [Paenibacillus sonchi]
MLSHLTIGIISIFILYMLLPSLLTRLAGYGVMRRGTSPKEVAFTFDDGPHPEYTPRLLDLLAQHKVKATFFVLGSQAERYPELIRRMDQEGHQIGIHNYIHTSNWLMLPGTIRRGHLKRTADIVESIIGTRPDYYRPPWGLINMFDFFRLKQYRIVLWSLMAHDWSRKKCQTSLRSTLLNRIRDGSIIVLHDSGDTLGADGNAPHYMLQALEEVLNQLKTRNLKCVRVDEMA